MTKIKITTTKKTRTDAQIRAYKKWYDNNKETILQKHKERYKQNTETIKANVLENYKKNKKQKITKVKEYQKQNHDKIIQYRLERKEIESNITRCIYFDCYQCNFTWEEAVQFDKLFKQHKDKLSTCFITTGNVEDDGYIIELFDYRINIDSLADDIDNLQNSDEEGNKFYRQAVEWKEFVTLANKLCAFCKKYKIAFILLPKKDWTANA